MDGQVRRLELVEKWRNAEFEGRTHLGPKPAGPMPKTLAIFATEEQRQAHLEAVKQAREQHQAPF